jgi:hypothetical protein
MEDKDKQDRVDGEEQRNEDRKVEIIKKHNTRPNDAGPSGCVSLPGEVPEPIKINFQSKTGISKSEHSIRHIITSKDVASALKSLSITSNQTTNNELKIPIIDKDAQEDKDPTTLIDLKKFMATCFKINKDTPSGVLLGDIPIQNIQTAPVITSEVIHDIPNTSCPNHEITANKTNEVVVTNSKGEEEKASRVPSEKKKTSGIISEKSDYEVGQRDSLSSIGSNVCRICMTRGRERFAYFIF